MNITKRNFLKHLFFISIGLFIPFKFPNIQAKKQTIYRKYDGEIQWEPIGYAKIDITKGQNIVIQVKNGNMYAKEIEFFNGNENSMKSYHLKRDWD